MKLAILVISLASLTAHAEEVIVVERGYLTTTARSSNGQTVTTPNPTYTHSTGYPTAQTITTPSGTYLTVPNHATGGTMAVIQTSRSGKR